MATACFSKYNLGNKTQNQFAQDPVDKKVPTSSINQSENLQLPTQNRRERIGEREGGRSCQNRDASKSHSAASGGWRGREDTMGGNRGGELRTDGEMRPPFGPPRARWNIHPSIHEPLELLHATMWR